MRDVAILGVGMIPFGRRDEDSLMEMLAYASLNALDDAGLGDKNVDAVYVGNMGGGIIQHQTAIASSLVDRLNLLPAAADDRPWAVLQFPAVFSLRSHRPADRRPGQPDLAAGRPQGVRRPVTRE